MLWDAFRAAPCVVIPSPSLASGLEQNAICCAAAGAYEGHKARAVREWSDLGHARHRAPAPIANSQRHHVHFLPFELGPSLASTPSKDSADKSLTSLLRPSRSEVWGEPPRL